MNPSLLYIGQVVPYNGAATSGGRIRNYHVLQALRSLQPQTESLNTIGGGIEVRALRCLLNPRTTLWVEYPAGLALDALAGLLSLLPWVRLILDVHDLPLDQYRALHGRDLPFPRRFLTRFIGTLLLWRASKLTLAAPGLRQLLAPAVDRKAVDMQSGCVLSTDSFNFLESPSERSRRKRLMYAGGITEGRNLDLLVRSISNSRDWELIVAGFGDANVIARLAGAPNVRFVGRLSHPQVLDYMRSVDAVAITYPRGPYYDQSLPVKLLDALSCSRPVIMARLPFAEAFVRRIGLVDQVIFCDDFSEQSLTEALSQVSCIRSDPVKTKAALKEYEWGAIMERVMPEVLLYNAS